MRGGCKRARPRLLCSPAPPRQHLLENFTIARVAGIPIRANLLLGYLLAFWAFWGASKGHASFTFLLISLSVVLLVAHELGHAFAARRFGLEIVDIVLWPLGGMARISDMPESPKVEAWVAAAGPLVNLVLAAVALPAVLLIDAPVVSTFPLFGWEVNFAGGVHGALTLFVVINLGYAIFNLVPAFPMDGGRILRAFLARGGRSWVTATDRATRLGSMIAWGAIFFALLHGACALALVGLFVLWAGLRERWAVRMKHHFDTAGGAQGRFAGWEELLRKRTGGAMGAPYGPVDAPPGAGGEDPTRSGESASPSPGAIGGSGGFSEEDIERLESFRGRITRPRPEGDG